MRANFYKTILPILVTIFIFLHPALAKAVVSDDFNAVVLDTGLWDFVDPKGDGQLVMTGTQLEISVPAGTSHDVWTSGNFAPRVMQTAADTDFEIEVKFESDVSEKYQLQGLLVEQDSGNFLRFDFYSNGSKTRLFAASFSDGSASVKKNVSIGSVVAPLYMRVSRQGDQWTQRFSIDGASWTNGAVFSRSMSVTEVGVFAGNAGASPAHTAVVDYFFNTASPIIPEDGENLYTLTVNVTGSGSVIKNPSQAAYAQGETVELTAVPAAGWTFDGWSGSASGLENPITVTVDSDLVIDAAFVLGPVVEYTLDVFTQGSGQVVLNPSGGIYTEGTTVALTAVADAGWQFSGWSGDLSGTVNPASLIMTQDYAVTATFASDTTPPVISNISVGPSETSATITWTTDEPTTGVVDYGETTSYELGSVTDTSLVQNHTVTLTGLIPGTSYHLQISASDNSGNETSSSDVAFSTTTDASGIDSDDFNAVVLDTGLWDFVDPKGDGQLVMTGTQLEISVPAGVSHDVWTSGNFAPRIMQAAADTDFEIEVKFESGVSAKYQLQGLLVEQDSNNFLRFDFYSDGSSTRLFAASFSGGSASVKKNVSIGFVGEPLYMRVSRQGDQWTQRYSTDGVNWTTGAVFSRAMSVAEVGVFAGNAGAPPAHTAVVDYFFNTASPIIPEDGENLYTLTVNVTGSGSVIKNPSQAAYAQGETVELTAVPAAGWTFDGWSGDASGLDNPITVTVDSDLVIDAAFVLGPAVEYTLDVSTQGSGQVALNPSGDIYTEGTTVALTAVADAGWQFSGWSGDLSGTTNPASLIMTQDYAVTATFASDTTPPVISNISVGPSETSATITWTTDEPTTGVVDYGETMAYELGSVTDTSLVQNHTVTLTDLIPGTSYHFQISASDNSGNETSSSDVAFSTTTDASGIDSDDFNAVVLDTGLWEFVDPKGDGQLVMTGTQLEISVPAGTSHDVWTSGNFASRVMQAAADTDFEIEVKFESDVSEPYQLQGLLIEQDSNNYLRLDFYSDGSSTLLFAASFSGGSASVKKNVSIGSVGEPLYMQVSRQGDQWTQRYSTDGVNWTTGAVFTRSLLVTEVGVFAGNAGASPAHTAVVDYFFNTASPIIPEDGGWTPPANATLDINVSGFGLVNIDPDKPTYQIGETVMLTAVPDSGYAFAGWSGSIFAVANPIVVTMDNDKIITAGFVEQGPGPGDGPSIDVWYGSAQVFGQIGVPQRWVNILGNVSDPDGVSSLRYSLNGGPEIVLSIGPDQRRLDNDGDFNADILYSDLVPGQNQLTITAIDSLNNQTIENVDLQYSSGNVWPEAYSIDWSTVQDIQDVAQIVDGKWKIENNAVRTEEPGYDRLIAIGDVGWDDFEATVRVKVHSFTTGKYGSGVGLILRWDGHYAWDSTQPAYGWYPLGAIGWYRDYGATNTGLRIQGGEGSGLYEEDQTGFTLTPNIWYIYKMRVVSNGDAATYSLKVWEEGATEPSAWTIVDEDSYADLQTGSLVLLAHNTDASFGNVSITPIE